VLDPRTVEEMRVLGLRQMRELYAGFAATLRRDAARLAGLDGEDLARALHKLKGSSASFGAYVVADRCAEAEPLVGSAAPVEIVAPVLAAADGAVDAIDALLVDLAQTDPVAAGPLTANQGDGW
jgi:HPt (histidine-containing phosphotransfer) domain-containing protein